MAGEVIITDEEYRAYIALAKEALALRNHTDYDPMLEVLFQAVGRVVAAHNKRLNSLRSAHGT